MKNLGFNVFGREAMEEFLEKHNLQDLLQAIAELKEIDTIKQKAIADGTFMKAPNGKPTNLNEKQGLQVRTTNFKKWFGDWENNPSEASKIVDDNGEPLVVYHGNRTDEPIKSFKKEKLGTEHRERNIKGFWFITDKRIAKEEYALKPESLGKGRANLKYGEVIPVFLNIKVPIKRFNKT